MVVYIGSISRPTRLLDQNKISIFVLSFSGNSQIIQKNLRGAEVDDHRKVPQILKNSDDFFLLDSAESTLIYLVNLPRSSDALYEKLFFSSLTSCEQWEIETGFISQITKVLAGSLWRT